ncbi:hypothetical protein GTA08_BOTSDO04843 [Botryosphaeria dothidea]|uniref:Integral membrane protein n=1 Tax=Botryosphaeria dothidea TaxID=55169 RepID=A0A8H4IYL1_9PEZI|nr:hypothetical protein GTA08_BOTSDO04843 [Botryosphaeria dothidea]
MSLGLMLGLVSSYLLIRPSPSLAAAKDNLTTAAIIGSLYWASGLSAIFYPGTDWCDPEFKDLYKATQKPVFTVYMTAIWVG